MKRSKAVERYRWDSYLGVFFILYTARIPLGGYWAQSNLVWVALADFCCIAFLVLPLMLSLRFGAILQLIVQSLILIGPFLFGGSLMNFDVPQLIAAFILFYCLCRLTNQFGPPLITLRKQKS